MTIDQEPVSAATDEARARASTYAFLAEVFGSHPSRHTADALCALAAELNIACPSGLSVAELDQEFMELLVVPNPRYVAPYESVFRDQWLLPAVAKRGSDPSEGGPTIKGLVMGESTLAVRQCYLGAGVLPAEDLPDHIANELRFLACLCSREAEAPPGQRQALVELRADFCRQHLLQWIAQLRDKVAARERLGYYSAAVKLVETLLEAG